jgi:hypothetical protein
MTLLYKIRAMAEEGRNTGRITVITDAKIIEYVHFFTYRGCTVLSSEAEETNALHAKLGYTDCDSTHRETVAYAL